MNLRQTAEVAALAALRAEEIIRRPQPIATESLHGYWKSSRVRLRCWFAALRSFPTTCDTDVGPSPHRLYERVRLARSVLIAELLTRVWSTVLVARDAARSETTNGELVRNVFLGQQEARMEVLKLLADERRLPMPEAATIDRLRRRVERWTDLLLGPLVEEHNVTEFTFDEDRARDFVRCNSSRSLLSAPDAATHHLTLISLSHAIPLGAGVDHVGAALDLAVAHSVLSALPRGIIGHERLRDVNRGNGIVLSGEQPLGNTPASERLHGFRFAAFRGRRERPQDHADPAC